MAWGVGPECVRLILGPALAGDVITAAAVVVLRAAAAKVGWVWTVPVALGTDESWLVMLATPRPFVPAAASGERTALFFPERQT